MTSCLISLYSPSFLLLCTKGLAFSSNSLRFIGVRCSGTPELGLNSSSKKNKYCIGPEGTHMVLGPVDILSIAWDWDEPSS